MLNTKNFSFQISNFINKLMCILGKNNITYKKF